MTSFHWRQSGLEAKGANILSLTLVVLFIDAFSYSHHSFLAQESDLYSVGKKCYGCYFKSNALVHPQKSESQTPMFVT